MRCLFNRYYRSRIESGELRELKRNQRNAAHPPSNCGHGCLSVEAYYGSPNGEIYAMVQFFERANGSRAASARMDPKRLVDPDDSVAYHLHDGSGPEADLKRNPERIYGNPFAPGLAGWRALLRQKVYGFARRLECWRYGPTAAEAAKRDLL